MDTSADNPAFESTEVPSEKQADSLVPYTKRENFYFEPFDSISEFSETTVPSEFAEIELEAYELSRKQRLAKAGITENDSKQKSNNIQYNLKFNKVVIVSGNENKDASNIEGPVSEAVNEIITQKVNFEEIPFKYVGIDENKLKSLIRKKTFYIPFTLLILILIGVTAFALYLAFTDDTHESPQASTTTESNIPPATTTPLAPIQQYKVVKRSDWKSNDNPIPFVGKYKLMAPVDKIILLNAITSQCETDETCMEYMNEQQQNAYPDYDDIRENYIIALDGTIFEGRGFEREGDTTCESDQITCYNNKAISISFLQTAHGDEVNRKQYSSFCQFIKDERDMGHIDDTYIVFNHNHLISSTVDLDEYRSLRNCSNFHTYVPQIFRRNKTLEVDYYDDLRRVFSTKVVLTTTGGETCETLDECYGLVNSFHSQNIHQSNFIFGGDGFIFEDRNFDLAVNETLYDVLLISFIGNYSTSLPSQPLITRLNNVFLDYAIKLGKLPRSYKICVTNESQTLITAIRNLHSSEYDNFCNEQM